MKKCYGTNYLKKQFYKEINFRPLDDVKRTKIQLDFENICQTILGFGGAFTEAAAHTYNQANDEVKKQIMEMYFNRENGLGYELGRLAINSCDFAIDNYTYVEEDDQLLTSFSLARDEKEVIPFLNEALKYQPELKLMAAPWSPPSYMKTNNNMNNGGKLLKAYYSLWADYLIKYLEEMAKRGIKIEFISIQNEPEANQTWDSCLYTPEEAREFVKVLGPKLTRKKLDVKVVVLDHNRDILEKWANSFASDKEALKYTWGLGVHWYVSEDFNALRNAKQIAPKLELIFTEGCIEGGPQPEQLATGERYARNIIGELNNGTIGFIDWNLILNEQGGPNHVGNFCDAPLLYVNNELVVNSSYYYIGHFAKYLHCGSKIISSTVSDNDLQVLAAINEKNQKVIVIVNPSERNINYQINGLDEETKGSIHRHTIQTWVVE